MRFDFEHFIIEKGIKSVNSTKELQTAEIAIMLNVPKNILPERISQILFEIEIRQGFGILVA